MSGRSGELSEMKELLRRAGIDPSQAERLAKEGMGPHELEGRLAIPSGVGSLSHSHGIHRKSASELEREIAEAIEGGASSSRKKKENRSADRPPKISTTSPATMTAGAINKELDRLGTRDSILTRQMIDAGRGHERPSDYRHKTDDMSSELNRISERRSSLRIEIGMRYGPNAPARLPAGRSFGPRKKSD